MANEHPTNLYEREWKFNKENPSGPPNFGVCFSGGGNRSASFAIGVLTALHELGLLHKVDVISAVSGGSYALSWFLLQPFYHKDCVSDPRGALPKVQEEMFNPDGPFQRYLTANMKPIGAQTRIVLLWHATFALLFDVLAFNALRLLSMPLANWAESAPRINATSMIRTDYRSGIQKTYQFFPDPEKKVLANRRGLFEAAVAAAEFVELTDFDISPVSFPTLSDFAHRAGLPSFVFNASVVPPPLGQEVPLTSRIFELGSMGFGSGSCGYLAWEDTEQLGWEPGAQLAKGWFWKKFRLGRSVGVASPYATIRNFNTAPAISGAAVDAANIREWRLRWLIRLLNFGLAYLVPSPIDASRLIRLSDGGYSENLGLYALLRRRCRTILIVDSEHDPSYSFGAYRKVKQAALRELGVELNIPQVDSILSGASKFRAEMPIMEGTTTVNGEAYGKIVYVKLSMDESLLGDQAGIVKRYAQTHEAFPQESTVDQYFAPERFRAYRALGCAIGRALGRTLSFSTLKAAS